MQSRELYIHGGVSEVFRHFTKLEKGATVDVYEHLQCESSLNTVMLI